MPNDCRAGLIRSDGGLEGDRELKHWRNALRGLLVVIEPRCHELLLTDRHALRALGRYR